MPLQENIAVSQPIIPYQFSEANLAVSQTDTDVPILGADTTTYLMPANGFIVGYAIGKSANHTAGSLDFDLTIDGTSTLTIAADTTSVYAFVPVPNEYFAAGSTLGVTYTSDGSLDPTTVDVAVTVFVVFQEFEF